MKHNVGLHVPNQYVKTAKVLHKHEQKQFKESKANFIEQMKLQQQLNQAKVLKGEVRSIESLVGNETKSKIVGN